MYTIGNATSNGLSSYFLPSSSASRCIPLSGQQRWCEASRGEDVRVRTPFKFLADSLRHPGPLTILYSQRWPITPTPSVMSGSSANAVATRVGRVAVAYVSLSPEFLPGVEPIEPLRCAVPLCFGDYTACTADAFMLSRRVCKSLIGRTTLCV